MRKLMFPLSLIFIATAIFLLIEYSDSQRMSSIAGLFTSIGFSLNIVSYLVKENKKK